MLIWALALMMGSACYAEDIAIEELTLNVT